MCGRLPRLCLEAGGWLVLMEWRVCIICMYCKWRECGGVKRNGDEKALEDACT